MVKPDALWSEEERKLYKEYEKKVKELNEERDKYRKVRRVENMAYVTKGFVSVSFQMTFQKAFSQCL